jgi:hypothetical protein
VPLLAKEFYERNDSTKEPCKKIPARGLISNKNIFKGKRKGGKKKKSLKIKI